MAMKNYKFMAAHSEVDDSKVIDDAACVSANFRVGRPVTLTPILGTIPTIFHSPMLELKNVGASIEETFLTLEVSFWLQTLNP